MTLPQRIIQIESGDLQQPYNLVARYEIFQKDYLGNGYFKNY